MFFSLIFFLIATYYFQVDDYTSNGKTFAFIDSDLAQNLYTAACLHEKLKEMKKNYEIDMPVFSYREKMKCILSNLAHFISSS